MTAGPPVVLQMAEWPADDRAAWARTAERQSTPFRKDGGGSSPAPATLDMRCKAYGGWLAFLAARGELTPPSRLRDRVTVERLEAFIEWLSGRGNAGSTICWRLHQLRAALRMMEPGDPLKWIVRPNGIPVERFFVDPPRDRPTHHSATLLAWAEHLFARGLAHRKRNVRRALVRDAAMVAVFVMPAPRVGAVARLRLGYHLVRHEDGWFLEQQAGRSKTKRSEMCPLIRSATPILDRYVSVERVELLAGADTDAMWIKEGGCSLGAGWIGKRISKLSARHFDVPFSPHTFRRSLSTTNVIEGYNSPLDGSTLLGHTSPTMTNAHYNRAKAAATAHRHADRIKKIRKAVLAPR